MAWPVPAGKRWKGCYRDSTGKQRSRTFDRKRDALAWAEEQEAAIRKGEWIDPNAGAVEFEVWADRWLAERTDLKPKTKQSYESLLRTQIKPRFGSVKLSRIDQLSVRSWVSETAAVVSPSRTRQAYHLLGAILRSAVDGGLLRVSPCRGIALPRLPQSFTTVLTSTEVALVGDAIEERFRALVVVLAYCGLRLGEALALNRRAYDELRSRLHVQRSLAEVGGHLVFGDTKTHQHRVVGLGKTTKEVLQHHLDTFTVVCQR